MKIIQVLLLVTTFLAYGHCAREEVDAVQTKSGNNLLTSTGVRNFENVQDGQSVGRVHKMDDSFDDFLKNMRHLTDSVQVYSLGSNDGGRTKVNAQQRAKWKHLRQVDSSSSQSHRPDTLKKPEEKVTIQWGLFKKIGRLFKKAWKGVKKVGRKIYHGAKRFAKKAWHGFKKVGRTVWNKVKKVGKKVWRIGKKLVKGVKKIGTKVLHGIKKVGKVILKKVKTVAKKAWKVVKKVGKTVWKGIKVVGKVAIKFAKSPIGKMLIQGGLAAFGVPPTLSGAALNVATGLLSGQSPGKAIMSGIMGAIPGGSMISGLAGSLLGGGSSGGEEGPPPDYQNESPPGTYQGPATPPQYSQGYQQPLQYSQSYQPSFQYQQGYQPPLQYSQGYQPPLQYPQQAPQMYYQG